MTSWTMQKKGVPVNLFNELLEILEYGLKKFLTSRIFVVGILFCAMFGSLVYKLYSLQIVNSSYYQNNYIQKTRKTTYHQAARGNIYDRNGKVLAYNELTYSVTFTDTGKLPTGFDKNEVLIPLVEILFEHGETVRTSFPMAFDEDGNIVFTTRSAGEKSVLLQNIYGVSRDKFNTEDRYGNYLSSSPDPTWFYNYSLHKFGIGYNSKGFGTDKETTYEIDPEVALAVLNIRYTMYLHSYMKYESIDIADNLKMETLTDILEHENILPEIGIEEQTVRIYNDALYFAHIIGYTGIASEADLEALTEENDTYQSGDIVGRAGIEQRLELTLAGQKGVDTYFLDSEGRILEVTEHKDAVAGDNIYLTLDADMMIGIYHILEQKLAAILVSRLVNMDVNLDDVQDSSKIMVPIKDAYFQLINNNVLSMAQFARPDASGSEQTMYSYFSGRLLNVTTELSSQMANHDTTPFINLGEAQQDYYDYLFDYLIDEQYLIVNDEIRSDQIYQDWQKGAISFSTFLSYAVSDNWITTSGLTSESGYSTAEETYQMIVTKLMEEVKETTGFGKLIYKYLIKEGSITGNQVCLALIAQGKVPHSDEDVALLSSGSSEAAYQFMIRKISSLEITPQQLALDPCTAACTLIDVRTGEPIAIVSYPGYDNNYFSGSVNGAYYNKLLNDLSNPLYNNATQTRTAPGSTFKPVTATAGLQEGVVDAYTTIEDKGIFTELGLKLRCWAYPYSHGAINVSEALRDSCNYYFSEVGYRLSLNSEGNYNEPLGLSRILKWASAYGLNEVSGVEITEIAPHVSDYGPVASSIGQGTHAFANVQLARYVTTVANMGTLYRLSIVKQRTDSAGNVVEVYEPQVEEHEEIMYSTLNTIHQGMRMVVSEGSVKSIFDGCPVSVAGKTGTAEESSKRGPHALFIGFAPYESPEVALAVTVPFGYSSSHAAEIAREVLDYYYGAISLEQILAQGASDTSGITIND